MITTRTWTILIAVLPLTASLLHAQDFGRHREITLGSNVVAVAGAHGLSSTDVKTRHTRPALLQDLEWQSRRFLNGPSATADPMKDITFSFYDGQLFRIVANYDQSRTEGLTDADLIDAMRTAYGPPQAHRAVRTPNNAPRSPRNAYADEEQVIARWEDADSAITLLRTRYPSAVSLVVLSKRVAVLAQFAEAEAARLDRLEAPRQEATRLQQEADELRASGERARSANKAIFKP